MKFQNVNLVPPKSEGLKMSTLSPDLKLRFGGVMRNHNGTGRGRAKNMATDLRILRSQVLSEINCKSVAMDRQSQQSNEQHFSRSSHNGLAISVGCCKYNLHKSSDFWEVVTLSHAS